jgi:energy-coupling factor transport system substrate-specific component
MTTGAGGLRGWSTRDLMVVAALGVVFGVALIPLLYASIAMRGALGPVGDVLYTPLFFIPSLMALYITRRPGAGLVSGFFIGLVQVPFTPFGWGALLGALNAGVCCELPFLATRYRRFGLPMILVAGTVAVVCNMALFYVPFGYLNLAVPVQLALVAGFALSGALLGGLPAKLLADALAKTGVLSAYRLGHERREEI